MWDRFKERGVSIEGQLSWTLVVQRVELRSLAARQELKSIGRSRDRQLGNECSSPQTLPLTLHPCLAYSSVRVVVLHSDLYKSTVSTFQRLN